MYRIGIAGTHDGLSIVAKWPVFHAKTPRVGKLKLRGSASKQDISTKIRFNILLLPGRQG